MATEQLTQIQDIAYTHPEAFVNGIDRAKTFYEEHEEIALAYANDQSRLVDMVMLDSNFKIKEGEAHLFEGLDPVEQQAVLLGLKNGLQTEIEKRREVTT